MTNQKSNALKTRTKMKVRILEMKCPISRYLNWHKKLHHESCCLEGKCQNAYRRMGCFVQIVGLSTQRQRSLFIFVEIRTCELGLWCLINFDVLLKIVRVSQMLRINKSLLFSTFRIKYRINGLIKAKIGSSSGHCFLI